MSNVNATEWYKDHEPELEKLESNYKELPVSPQKLDTYFSIEDGYTQYAQHNFNTDQIDRDLFIEAGLTDKEASVLVFYFEHGKSFSKIAERYNNSKSTIHYHYENALRKIREVKINENNRSNS